jgi:hypothetical protein
VCEWCCSRTPGSATSCSRNRGIQSLSPILPPFFAVLPDPDHRELDPRPSRERFFKQGVGLSKWLMVVVDSERELPRIVTALGYGHGESPSGWTT